MILNLVYCISEEHDFVHLLGNRDELPESNLGESGPLLPRGQENFFQGHFSLGAGEGRDQYLVEVIEIECGGGGSGGGGR